MKESSLLKPGAYCPVSGLYKVVSRKTGRTLLDTYKVKAGNRMPPTNKPGCAFKLHQAMDL